MNTTLNNYTIEDFLKLKPIIYEYCCNLTQKRTSTSWFRDFADADDLYQEVCLKFCIYLNSNPIINSEEHFEKLAKRFTYLTHVEKYKKSESKVLNNIFRYDTSPIDFALFNNTQSYELKVFDDYKDNPDYLLFTEYLTKTEKHYIDLLIQGYTIEELSRKYRKNRRYFKNIIHSVETQMLTLEKPKIKSLEKVSDKDYVRRKIPAFSKVFKDDKFIKLYALYLKGFDHKVIAKKLNKSVSQINVEIYRINQKIKKYAI
jgi:hypothetical protein